MQDHHAKLADKVALVTGAASGIGRATAQTFAAQGATVVCADLDLTGAEATAVECRGRACQLDVTAEPAWEAALAEVLGRERRLDVAVNCAGVSFACPVADMSLTDWKRVLAVNLDGVFLGTKHAIRAMRQDGRGGSIVNVASVSGVTAQPGASAYCASKAAVIMFTRSAALECRRNGDPIRINSIAPAGVKTPMWGTMPFFQDLVAKHGSEDAAYAALGGRFALPEEVARAVLFLASAESALVSGTNLMFDGGDA